MTYQQRAEDLYHAGWLPSRKVGFAYKRFEHWNETKYIGADVWCLLRKWCKCDTYY